MSRTVRALWRRPLSALALSCVALMCLVALGADLLASDLPLLARVDGRLRVLPQVLGSVGGGGGAFAHEDLASLRERVATQADGWLLPPPIPYGPQRTDVVHALAPPSAEHPFGTDELGRDVLARMVHGARASLSVGFVAVALYVLLGTLLGALAGYYGGKVDAVISRLTEVMMSFPTFFLVLAVLGLMRVTSLLPVMVVLGLTRWTDVSRLVRAEVLRLRELDFVEASRALGASPTRIVLRHLLPNAMGPVLVAATFGVAGAILLESALSFLGFGVPPPAASWGELLTQAHRYVTHPGAWWLTLFPGLALFVTVTAFNLLGEALRDEWDPRVAAERSGV